MYLNQLPVPHGDNLRLITHNGFNMVEFPTDYELDLPYAGADRLATAVTSWIDYTLAANQHLAKDSPTKLESLWIPTSASGQIYQLTSTVTRTAGEYDESTSYFETDYNTIPVTVNAKEHGIATVPTRVSPRLHRLFSSRVVEQHGNFEFGQPLPSVARRIGHLLLTESYDEPQYLNLNTGKHPRSNQAHKVAIAVIRSALKDIGYDQSEVENSQRTFSDYIAELEPEL